MGPLLPASYDCLASQAYCSTLGHAVSHSGALGNWADRAHSGKLGTLGHTMAHVGTLEHTLTHSSKVSTLGHIGHIWSLGSFVHTEVHLCSTGHSQREGRCPTYSGAGTLGNTLAHTWAH
jgi:hypothetical protein